MKRVVVVGSGAGGATVAKELQGKYDVTVLEAGRGFRPFSFGVRFSEKIKRTGLLFDERIIQLFFPSMKIRISKDEEENEKLVLVNGICTGGSTVLSTGNAIRMDKYLKDLGINLDAEFEEISREIPITTDHRRLWRKHTREMFEVCQKMGLNPKPTPKMGNYERCRNCGRCVMGCAYDVKWDSRRFLDSALERGARLIEGCRVEKVVIDDKHATGVIGRTGVSREFFPADLVVLAAGGMGTPVILQNSGIATEPHLFVDPVLCVAAEVEDCIQYRELPMPFVVQKEHFIISPYFDYVSFFFNRRWRLPAADILGVMIKLADTEAGRISEKKIYKSLTQEDRERLKEGINLCTEVLYAMGIKEERVFYGTLNAGHPGGSLPLTEKEAETLHHSRLPENLFVADASLFPKSAGNPIILTIIALAKRVSRICAR